MADEKKVERELLADGIRINGVDYTRGDTITITEKHAEALESHGSVGAKGSVRKAEDARAERDEAEARHQRYLQGLADPDEQPAQEPARSSPRQASK